MFLTFLPLKSGPFTESSVIAKSMLGNFAAICASDAASRKPAAMIRFARLRTAVVRFGM